MSIMSKYLVTATMVNRQKQVVDQPAEEHAFSDDFLQSQAETRWWRLQWLSQRRESAQKEPTVAANPSLLVDA